MATASAMILQEWMQGFERVAPPLFAEAWDNVGLLVGCPKQSLTSVLITVDLTPEVMEEAVHKRANLVLAYHPPIFKPISRLTAGTPVFTAASQNIAIYSPHTAFDACVGGTNDFLINVAGITEAWPLRKKPLTTCRSILQITREEKSALGVLHHKVPGVCAAPTTWFGGVSQDSQRLLYRESFILEAATDPNPCLMADAPPSSALIRPEHECVGQGRYGDLAASSAITLHQLASQLRQNLQSESIQIASAPSKRGQKISRIACAAGAGDDLLSEVITKRADVFITGELRHHSILRCTALGIHIILLSHDGSERPALTPLRDCLKKEFPRIDHTLAEADESLLSFFNI